MSPIASTTTGGMGCSRRSSTLETSCRCAGVTWVLVGLSVGRASQWQFSQVPGFLPNTELYPKRNETFRSYHADAASAIAHRQAPSTGHSPSSPSAWDAPLQRRPQDPDSLSVYREPCRIRPAFVPRTTWRRQETARRAGASNPQVRNQIRVSSLVAKSAAKTLSRWRHGFEPRWDYERTRVRSLELASADLIRRK